MFCSSWEEAKVFFLSIEYIPSYLIVFFRAFSAGDAFVGFHEDTIPSVVIQVCNELEGEEQEGISQDGTEDPWESEVKTKLSLTKRISSNESAEWFFVWKSKSFLVWATNNGKQRRR